MRHPYLPYQQHRSTRWSATLLFRLVACLLLSTSTAALANAGATPLSHSDQEVCRSCGLSRSKRGCHPSCCCPKSDHGAKGDTGADGARGEAGPAGPSFNTYAWAFNNTAQTLNDRLISFTGGNSSNNLAISTSGSPGPDTFTLLYSGTYLITWFAVLSLGDPALYVNGSPMSPSLVAATALHGGLGTTIQQFSAGDFFQINSTSDSDEMNHYGNSDTAMNAFIAIQRIN